MYSIHGAAELQLLKDASRESFVIDIDAIGREIVVAQIRAWISADRPGIKYGGGLGAYVSKLVRIISHNTLDWTELDDVQLLWDLTEEHNLRFFAHLYVMLVVNSASSAALDYLGWRVYYECAPARGGIELGQVAPGRVLPLAPDSVDRWMYERVMVDKHRGSSLGERMVSACTGNVLSGWLVMWPMCVFARFWRAQMLWQAVDDGVFTAVPFMLSAHEQPLRAFPGGVVRAVSGVVMPASVIREVQTMYDTFCSEQRDFAVAHVKQWPDAVRAWAYLLKFTTVRKVPVASRYAGEPPVVMDVEERAGYKGPVLNVNPAYAAVGAVREDEDVSDPLVQEIIGIYLAAQRRLRPIHGGAQQHGRTQGTHPDM